MGTAESSDSTFRAERLAAFTDAVIAVAITLLVLDLKLPEGVADAALPTTLAELSHAFWCYVLSFVVIGALWVAHHRQFAHIERVDGVLLWLNLFFLMAVALIPFVTSVMSEHGGPLPTALYAAALMASCLMLTAIWWYASRRPALMPAAVSLHDRRAGIITPLLIAAVFGVSIGIAYAVDATAAQWSWLLAALAGPVGDRLSRA